MRELLRKCKAVPYVSGGLVIINILVFLWCTFGGELLYNVGGLSPYSFWEQKQYYRLFSSMFLHGDINHIINNMLLLFGLGTMIEKEIGHLTFALSYFITGIAGGVVSLYYKAFLGEWYVSSIGASGAVFGLVGVLLALAFFSGVQMPNVTPLKMLIVVAYSVYSGMGEATIDNAAHIGGVIAGVVVGLVLCIKIRVKRRKTDVYIGGYHED